MSNPRGIGGFVAGYDPQRGYANAPARIKSRIRSLYRGYDGQPRIVARGETIYEELAF